MLNHTKLQFGQSFVFGILAAAAIGAAVPAAHAAEQVTAEAMSFAVLDLNQDGFIDKKEAGVLPSLTKVFDTADQDKDGRLSPTEYAKASAPKPS